MPFTITNIETGHSRIVPPGSSRRNRSSIFLATELGAVRTSRRNGHREYLPPGTKAKLRKGVTLEVTIPPSKFSPFDEPML